MLCRDDGARDWALPDRGRFPGTRHGRQDARGDRRAATAAGVGLHYGADLLDGWLVDTSDAAAVEPVEAAGILCRGIPLLMTSVPATAQMALAALGLAAEVER